MDMQSLTGLTDSELLTRVRGLVRNERHATAALVAHLAEIENRRLYLGEACSSLFTYCIRVLHLSEPAAYNRIQAARVARRFPAVLVSLEQGLLHLTAVRLLAPILTVENHHELLSAAAHKSKREVEELLAHLRPQADIPGQVRKLPAMRKAAATAGTAATAATPAPAPAPRPASTRELFGNLEDPARTNSQAPSAQTRPEQMPVLAVNSPAQRAVVVPLAPERYKVQFTAGAATHEKLRRAQELLKHRIPDGDVAQVIDAALDLLVRELEKKKFAATDRPRRSEGGTVPPPSPSPSPSASLPSASLPSASLPSASLPSASLPSASLPSASLPSASVPAASAGSSPTRVVSRYIAVEVRRAVWARDQGQCSFMSAMGERCTERSGLEFDHIRPHADGGSAAVNNMRLLCRQHNQHESRQFFGVWATDHAPHPAARRNGSRGE